MGEFHFSRYPAAEWEHEILKMKAAGVEIVATYVIWIHHEQAKGVFDWSGQRDLRRFVQLCGKHGMYVYPRIGPWAHAEARNGGFPDWVVKAGPTRENNPQYLAEVQTFYAEIAKQLKGELWKDGGPVIGIQIENEYRARGPGKGDEHIRTLKQMAIADGLDVPLYTVTGWDGAAIPPESVLPVFGGYADAPWDDTAGPLPPNEVYEFRFNNRAAGNMGALGGRGQNAASSYRGTPFLTAEVGDGIEDTYFRRPVVSADDIAAIPTVMLGSGANLLGYYMFHGGRNPDADGITLNESQATGYPTDVPVKSYDFQAPLGEYGQESPSLRKLKLVHYFLHDFGAQLAPMQVHAPDRLPASSADASVPRVALRSLRDQGFVFFSNYVRNLRMEDRPGFQLVLALPSGTMRVPESPIRLPAASYGIWPVNLPLGNTTLRYSTAQPLKRMQVDGRQFFFFFGIPGIDPEFLLRTSTPVRAAVGAIQQRMVSAGVQVRITSPSAEFVLADGTTVVLIPEAEAENVWRVDDPDVLLKSVAYAISDGRRWTLESTGQPSIAFAVFGSHKAPQTSGPALRIVGKSLLWTNYHVSLPPVSLNAQVSKTRDAGPSAPWKQGPAVPWRRHRIPIAPDEKAFAVAAIWRLTVPPVPAGLADTFLRIRYQGDVARLYQGDHLLDDNFWNGLPWTIRLRELGKTRGAALDLCVLPLPEKYPMFLEKASDLRFHNGNALSLDGVQVIPQYRLQLKEAR